MEVDLSTTYLGLKLNNPVVISASPLTGELDVLRRLEQAGAGAAVLPSLFEEQLEEAKPSPCSGGTVVDTLAYFHELKEYNRGPDVYLRHLENAKKGVGIPLIGSLNVTSPGPWLDHARRIEVAGADALELNLFFLPTDLDTTAEDVESRYEELVAEVHNRLSIPLAVKIGPYFTSLPNVAKRLVHAGADGIVLFNRFLQPDVDLSTLRTVTRLALSTPEELRLTLRWIGLMYGRLNASLAASTGAHFSDDVVKLILAGADVVMVASTLYRHGIDSLATLIDGVRYWMEMNEFRSLTQIRGNLSQLKCPDRSALARANYTRALASFVTATEANNHGTP